MTGLVSVGIFLTQMAFNSMLLVLWIRVFSRYFHVSSLHPVNLTLQAMTRPVLGFLENRLTTRYGLAGHYDVLSLACIVLVSLCKVILLGLLAVHGLLPLPWLLVFVLADVLLQPFNLFFYMILIRILLRFFNPGWRNPIGDLINQFTTPLLAKARGVIPLIAGFDVSPYITLLGLKTITLFITASLPLPLL